MGCGTLDRIVSNFGQLPLFQDQPRPCSQPFPPCNDRSVPSPSRGPSSTNHMAYSRRSIATPLSRGGNGTSIPNSRSRTSYQTTFLLILVLTSVYTAFLYQRGQYWNPEGSASFHPQLTWTCRETNLATANGGRVRKAHSFRPFILVSSRKLRRCIRNIFRCGEKIIVTDIIVPMLAPQFLLPHIFVALLRPFPSLCRRSKHFSRVQLRFLQQTRGRQRH